MADSFLSKAGALILSGAALLGVAYGGAKYVADFEAAKAEIQSLRGQIVQLQELLTKAQTGWDPARMERIEAQLAELRAQVGEPQDATQQKTVAEHLADGGFGGKAGDHSGSWPFRVANVKVMGNAQFEAELEWVTLDAVHRIRGNFSERTLFFKEVEAIKAGNTVIGCEYTLDTVKPDGMDGTWRNCDDGSSGGTIELKWR